MIKTILFILLFSCLGFSQCGYFDGVNDGYDSENSGGGFNGLSDATAMFWFKQDLNGTAVFVDAGAGSGNRNIYIEVKWGAPGPYWNVYWKVSGGGLSQLQHNIPAANYYLGSWHHFAVTYHANTSSQRMFIDGEEVSTVGTKTGNDILNTIAGAVFFGWDGSTSYIEGQFDDIKFFKILLSQAQIQSEMFNNDYCYTDDCITFFDFTFPVYGNLAVFPDKSPRNEFYTRVNADYASYKEDNCPTTGK